MGIIICGSQMGKLSSQSGNGLPSNTEHTGNYGPDSCLPGQCSREIIQTLRNTGILLSIKAPQWKWVLTAVPATSAGDPGVGLEHNWWLHRPWWAQWPEKAWPDQLPICRGWHEWTFILCVKMSVTFPPHIAQRLFLKPPMSWEQRQQCVCGVETWPWSIH